MLGELRNETLPADRVLVGELDARRPQADRLRIDPA
jgi:hypothetical protein